MRVSGTLVMFDRRQLLVRAAGGASTILLPATTLWPEERARAETVTITEGDLKVVFRDNSHSPEVLSGVDSLFNLKDAPGFDAFDPDTRGASAGLNFEHIISGHRSEHNMFSPRKGKFELVALPGGKSVQLVRKREDDPWSVSSTLTYMVREPHYIDVRFHCVPHDRAVFGSRGYAILFFANYMNDVEDAAIHFRGIEAAGQPEKWIAADAPAGHPDHNHGGNYRGATAGDLSYDADHNFKLNSWTYDYPRFTRPFYYGRAGHGMTLILMFDTIRKEQDEIRFSLYKFKLPRLPRPAWDFQYAIRAIDPGQEYGFDARLVWKKFVSAEDALREYETWRASGA